MAEDPAGSSRYETLSASRAHQNFSKILDGAAKKSVMIKGFADRDGRYRRASSELTGLEKILKFFRGDCKKRDTIEGFADRSEANEGDVNCLVFFKNIQPISVGV